MKAFNACLACNLNQALKVGELLQLDELVQEKIIRRTLRSLAEADYNMSSPELMLRTWLGIIDIIGNKDPYKETKLRYNRMLLDLEPVIRKRIETAQDPFNMLIKLAIAGNLIDFAPNYVITEMEILEGLDDVEDKKIHEDCIARLKNCFAEANEVLYIGDNCGEIVLDKICIAYLKQWFPSLRVTFVVRGGNILNDVTLSDAKMVKMQDVAEVIDNGDQALGTVYDRTSQMFRDHFQTADLIISKGQGNFEGLYGIEKSQVFFLFMAKCDSIANLLGVKKGSIVCIENPVSIKLD